MSEHIVPTRVYYTIFVLLMICTALTVSIATRLTWAVIAGGVFWLLILLTIIGDYLTRAWQPYGSV